MLDPNVAMNQMTYLEQENAVLHTRVRQLEIALSGRGSWTYAHMCRDEHQEIGHRDSEHERCPLCRANDAAEAEREACAKVAEDYGIARYLYEAEGNGGKQDAKTAAEAIASLIRGRVEK